MPETGAVGEGDAPVGVSWTVSAGAGGVPTVGGVVVAVGVAVSGGAGGTTVGSKPLALRSVSACQLP
ncbi:MAG TPA: hypothetical protein VNT52_10710, partial [Acidimicrobiales bacterium]|nr:hypothetical protein [Acidimicrobiales bacterium]